ncbi:TonB-dependent receptor [Novosphingobium sp.]|uniref:TonB-dependent receptor n=1 Tax=Novosphingobium sp. TaxID=1874826 RepID=UPI003BABC514
MFRIASLITACLMSSSSLYAQTPKPPAGAVGASAVQPNDATGDIIVTAEKRSSTLQKTPIAITALTGVALEQRNIQSAEALAVATPSLRYQEYQGNALLTLRGIGSDNITSGGDPAVAFYVDGVYFARTTSAEGLLFDVDRVEVLRGPQGTLYGRNATGGAINVVTRPAQFNQTAMLADATYGNYDRVRLRGAVNIPLATDRAAARISAVYEKRNGYQRNLASTDRSKDLDDADIFEMRGQLRLAPTDAIELTLRGTYSYRGGNGPAEKALGAYRPLIVANPAGDPPVLAFPYDAAIPFGFGARANPASPREVYLNGPNQLRVKTANIAATLNWELPDSFLGGATFRTIVGYQDQRFRFTRDSDMSEAQILFNDFIRQFNKQTSVESQLISKPGKFEWIVGGYYLRETGIDDIGISYGPIPPGLGAFTVPIGLKLDVTSTSAAAFGQGTIKLSPSLRMTAGLRYSHDRKEALSTFSFGGPTQTLPGARSWAAVTGKVGLDWTTAGGQLLYATVSRGYKAGGFSLAQPAYNPEYIWSYEAGAKLVLLDRRLRANLAAFYYNYSDLQVSAVRTGPNGAPTIVVDNAASSTVYGAEAELVATPIEKLQLEATLTYLHAKYDKYVTTDSANPAAGLVDFGGNALPNAPRFTATIAAQYGINLGSAGSLTPRVAFFWSDRQSLTPFARPATDIQGGYTRTDLTLSWASANQRFGLEAFVQNLENKDVLNRVAYIELLNNYRASYNPPRTYGVRASVRF